MYKNQNLDHVLWRPPNGFLCGTELLYNSTNIYTQGTRSLYPSEEGMGHGPWQFRMVLVTPHPFSSALEKIRIPNIK